MKISQIKNSEFYQTFGSTATQATSTFIVDNVPHGGMMIEFCKAFKPEQSMATIAKKFAQTKRWVGYKFNSVKKFFWKPEIKDLQVIPQEKNELIPFKIIKTKEKSIKEYSEPQYEQPKKDDILSKKEYWKVKIDKTLKFVGLMWLFSKLFPIMAHKICFINKLFPKVSAGLKVKTDVDNNEQIKKDLEKSIQKSQDELIKVKNKFDTIVKFREDNIKVDAPLNKRAINKFLSDKKHECAKKIKIYQDKLEQNPPLPLNKEENQSLEQMDKDVSKILNKMCVNTEYFDNGVSGIIYDQVFLKFGLECKLFDYLGGA